MAICGGDRKKLLDRLSRIEGQVKGIRAMIEKDAYCVDVLQQIAAVRGALSKASSILMEDHLRGCVAEALRSGEDGAKIDEIVELFERYVR